MTKSKNNPLSGQGMLDPIAFFGSLGVVPAVDGAHQITGDPADPLELPGLQLIVEDNLSIVSQADIQSSDFFLGLLFDAVNVSNNFPPGDILDTGDGNDGSVDVHFIPSFLNRRNIYGG